MTCKSLHDSYESNEKHKKLKNFLKRSHTINVQSRMPQSEYEESISGSSSSSSSSFQMSPSNKGLKRVAFTNYSCRPAGCPPIHNPVPKVNVSSIIQNFTAKYP
jgi:hypothetical protein